MTKKYIHLPHQNLNEYSPKNLEVSFKITNVSFSGRNFHELFIKISGYQIPLVFRHVRIHTVQHLEKREF